MDSRFWSRLCYYCSEWSRSKNNNQLTRNTPWLRGKRCRLRGKISWTIICHECQSLRTKREQWRWETKYSPVWGLKTWTLAAITDLKDIEFNREISQMDMDAVFRPCIDTTFPPTTFDDFSMEESVENPILLDEEEDKENAPPPTTTPKSVRPTEPPKLQWSCAYGARMENVPEYVFRNLFH